MNKQYWSRRIQNTEPYIPGEQPKDRRYVKLNTNENPYPPSPKVQEALQSVAISDLRLYPDPDCLQLRTALANQHHIAPENVFVGNGSDEILAFCYLAFMDENNPAIFPDITFTRCMRRFSETTRELCRSARIFPFLWTSCAKTTAPLS